MEAPALLLCLALVFAVLATPAFLAQAVESKPAAKPYDAAYAAVYDRLMYSAPQLKAELALVAPQPDSLLLDVGCGLGHLVAGLPCEAVGLDLSPDMVAAAAKRYPNRTFQVGDALNKRLFSTGTFTHVACFGHTLYYFSRKDLFFQNAHYWLTPGGFLALHLTDKLAYGPTRPNVRADFGYRGEQHGAVYRERLVQDGEVRRLEHRFYYESAPTVLDMVKQCGFRAHSSKDCAAGQLYLFQKI